MSLIKQIKDAVNLGSITQPFTTKDITSWINENNITKDDGGAYAESSVTSILSNSAVKNILSTNENVKVLGSQNNSKGKVEYWFLTD